MNNFSDLYQDVILAHNAKPKNFFKMKKYNKYAKGYNPLCGDQVELFSNIENDNILNISFWGKSCALCKASTSIMLQYIEYNNTKQALNIFNVFYDFLLYGRMKVHHANIQDLLIFKNVKKYPVRIKCVMLPWHTLNKILK